MIAALQQQLALLAVAPGAVAALTVPPAPVHAPAYRNYPRNNGRGNGGRYTQGSRSGYRGNRGGGGRNNYAPAPPAAAIPAAGIPPAPAAGSRNNPPNQNKWYNNMNYCYSCGFDVPLWHTSMTCNYRNHHHQECCTHANVAAYKAAGHAASDRNQFRTIMPMQPTAEQA